MNTNLIMTALTLCFLTACGTPNDVQKSDSSNSAPSGGGGVGGVAGNPALGSGLVAVRPGPTGGISNIDLSGNANSPGSSNSSLYNVIQSNYDRYLPHCLNPAREQFWESWFARGGTLANFVATLKIVATATTCSSEGQEITTDPHYIKGYFDFYLPGCYTDAKMATWQAWFANGGTDADFRTTLMQVSVTYPRPSCLTN